MLLWLRCSSELITMSTFYEDPEKNTNVGRFKKIRSWQIHRWPVAWHVKEPCGSKAHHHVNRAANIPWTLNHQPVKLRTSPSWTKMKYEPLTTNLSLWPTFAAQKLHPSWVEKKIFILAPYLFNNWYWLPIRWTIYIDFLFV